MENYKLNRNGGVVRLSDGAGIPTDERNADYQSYQDWIAAGNTPMPADPIDFRTPMLDRVRAARDEVLNRLMGIAFAAQASGDVATVNACLAARLSLLGITTAAGVVAATDEASLKAAFVAEYAAIVQAAKAAAPGIINAFAEFSL